MFQVAPPGTVKSSAVQSSNASNCYSKSCDDVAIPSPLSYWSYRTSHGLAGGLKNGLCRIPVARTCVSGCAECRAWLADVRASEPGVEDEEAALAAARLTP